MDKKNRTLIKELEQKINRTGQFHLDSINEKFAKLDKKINDNNDYRKLWEENTKDYNDLARKRLNDYTKGVKNSEKIEELEDSIKNSDILYGDAVRKAFARMDSVDDNINKLDNICVEQYDVLEAKINGVEQNIPDINQETDETRALKEYCDNLEGKYYTLRSELDAVYKVLEMDALDIQDLYNKLENHPKKKNALEQDFEELVKEGDKNAK